LSEKLVAHPNFKPSYVIGGAPAGTKTAEPD